MCGLLNLKAALSLDIRQERACQVSRLTSGDLLPTNLRALYPFCMAVGKNGVGTCHGWSDTVHDYRSRQRHVHALLGHAALLYKMLVSGNQSQPICVCLTHST